MERMVSIGPSAVPVVPMKHFTRNAVTKSDLASVWKIVGPSAQLNLERLPLWQVIAMAYVEGLNHGSGLQAEISRRDQANQEPQA